MNASKFRLFVPILLAPLFVCAGTKDSPLAVAPLTVVIDFEAPHSEDSLQALRHSLSRILSASGIPADVRNRTDLPEHPQFAQLVIFKMRGSCSMSSMPAAAWIGESGPLAMAYTSDGEVLHFGEVECDRVRHCIQRVVGLNSSARSEQSFGSALAIVMAHEIYHMLGNAKEHTHKGLTKPALTSGELLDRTLSLPDTAVEAIRKNSQRSFSDTRSDARE